MTTPRHADTPAGSAPAGPPGLLGRIARAWAAARSERAQPAPLVEEIEARLLYSADPAGAGLILAGAGASAVIEQRLVDDHGEFSQGTESGQRSRELLIVGAGIEDSRTLQDGLVRDGRDIEVLVLDPEADAMSQISAALAGRSDLSAIHILSHGASGQLQLQTGADTVDIAVLAARAGEVGRWGDALRPGGDILLYGCDVAAGDTGAAFVRQLSALTGADVAASDNRTGDSRLQGDWTLEFSSGRIDSATAFSAAAQAQWHGTLESRVNTVTQDKQYQAAVAVSASGSFVVTWTGDKSQDGNNTGVFAQRFDASGNPAGSQIQVNTDVNDRQEMSTVGVAADGSFVVAWASHNQQAGDSDGWGVKAQRFAANGSKVGAEFLVNQTTAKDQWQPSIAVAADGQFVVAWTSSAVSNKIFVRHFDAAGNALRGEVQASGVNSAGNQTLPSVAIAADGSYAVAWQSDNGGTAKSIFAQRFNADDTLRGAGFQVNTYDADDQTQPSVAVGANGAFVIAWTSEKQDGDAGGIYAQCYKADGSRDGAEFRVNTVTAREQNRPSAAMDGAGNFTIAWSSDGDNGGSSVGVHAQRYGAGGVPLGGPFLVNTTTSGDQVAPATAMNASGALAIAWEGVGIGDNDGVFVSSFVASNTAPTASPDTASVVQGGQLSVGAPGVLANDSDPDVGATLSVAALVSPVDGSVIEVTAAGVTVAGVYGSLSIKSDGSYLYTASSAAATALAAGQSGSDTFSYFVRDNNNSNASSTLTFTVDGVNDAPVASDDFYAVAKTGSLTVAAGGVLSNDADPDRNPSASLTVVSVDGRAASVGNDVAGVYGTLRVDGNGGLTYAPDSLNGTLATLVFGQSVTETFSYDVADGNGGISRATIQITIMGANRAPNASDDGGPGYAVQQDGVLATGALQGVLANDSDPDGNTLSAQLVSGPANGTLTLNGDGSFVYRPNPLYYGADSFTYRASDGSLASAAATVTLDVVHVNHDPAAAADSVAVAANGSVTVTAANGLLANDTDVDTGFGDRPAVTGVQAGDTVLTLAANSSGSLVTDYGTLFVSSDGAFRYVANGAASMSLGDGALTGDAFTYTVSDGQGGTATARLSIAISGVNDAPIISGATGNQSVNDNDTFAPFAGMSVADADSPAQQLSLRIALDDPASGSLSGTAGSYDAAAGVYTITGTAAQINAAAQGLQFSPQANRAVPGSVERVAFSITVSDGALGATATATVDVVSINDPPAVLAVSARGAQDGDTIAIVLAVSDIDGGDVSLVIASMPAQGALYLDAAGLSPLLPGTLVPTSGNAALVYFRPEPGWNGDTGFSYAAIDAQGLRGASAAVSIAIAASPTAVQAPLPQATPPQQAQPQQAQPQQAQPQQAQPQQAQPVEVQQQTPARVPALVPAAAAAAPAPAAESLAVAAAEPAEPSGAAPPPAPTPRAAQAAAAGLQPEAALALAEASVSTPSNQQPALAATPARSSGERASQASAILLAAFATADAGGAAPLAADLSVAQALAEGRIERAGAAARSETLARSLDQMRDSVKSAEEAEHRIVGSSVAVGASFSVGYVIWLLRGGVLATSLLSSLPAWRFVDPLPVLARMRQGSDDDDSDDSLESLVADDDGHEHNEGHEGLQGHVADGASPLQAMESKP